MEWMKWWTWIHLVARLWTIASIFLQVECESASHTRGHHSIELHKPNVVNNKEKAEELLQRYGYLRCHLWKRHRGKTKKRGIRYCLRGEVREAIRQYQRLFNIQQTGKLDKTTMKIMSASRCGNRDDEIGINSLDTFIAHHGKDRKRERQRLKGSFRQKRSLGGKASEFEFQLIENIKNDSLLRRQTWIQNQMRCLSDGKHPQLNAHQRRKRSIETETYRDIFSHEIITWRLIGGGYSDQMAIKAQRSSLALAFRMWSEVIPRKFMEDNFSPIDDVDILIAFGRGEHFNCPNNFDGFGGQLSHAIRQSSKAEIHVDDDEYFTLDSKKGTNLLKVAVHEVGHVLGLIHTRRNHSIMYAIYSEMIPNRNFELGYQDRQLVQSIYGTCNGKFNTVFDWVRHLHDNQLIYNTYFFRGDHYWLYENQYNRPRYGDPLHIATEWKGLQGPLDGFAHVWTSKINMYLFFKGDQFWMYNNNEDMADSAYPKLISESFQGMSETNHSSIPNDIDTVYFDRKDGNLYFFKDNLIYGYDVSKGDKGCCLPGYPKSINDKYPSFSKESELPSKLDAVYYSYTDDALYFFKNSDYWISLTYSRHKSDVVIGPYPINRKWRDICDV